MDTSRRTTYSTFLLRTFDDLRKFDPNFRERIVDNSQRANIRQSRQCSPNRIQNNDVADRAGRGKKTKKRNKDRERERKENRFLLDARTRRKKRSTWTDGFSPREEEEEEGGEKRVSVNRERTLPRYRGLDSKFKSYYPVDAIRRGLELGGRKGAEGEGREEGAAGIYKYIYRA